MKPKKKRWGVLLGRFSGRVLKTGGHLVPEAALEALASQNIPFTVQGKVGVGAVGLVEISTVNPAGTVGAVSVNDHRHYPCF